jgi:hypothetical protein
LESAEHGIISKRLPEFQGQINHLDLPGYHLGSPRKAAEMMSCVAVVAFDTVRMGFANDVTFGRQDLDERVPLIRVKNTILPVTHFVVQSPKGCSITMAEHPGHSSPDLPCTVILELDEWQVLYCHAERVSEPTTDPPSLKQAVLWIAKLGGFIARKSDGTPGPQVLWQEVPASLSPYFHVYHHATEEVIFVGKDHASGHPLPASGRGCIGGYALLSSLHGLRVFRRVFIARAHFHARHLA